MIRRNDIKGFTLIEVMAVTLFLAIIGVYTWGYMRTTINTQRKIEEKTTIQQTGNSIMAKLYDDISQVFFVESNQKLTFFKGEPNAISFSALSHDAPSPQDRECEEADIFYTLEDDKDDADGKTKVLMRKEIPYLIPEADKDTDFKAVPVAKRVLSLDFTYSDDGSKYLNEWDISSPDHPNKLPKLIKIVLVVRDPEGHEESFESLVALPMTDDLNIQPPQNAQGNNSGKKSGTNAPGQGNIKSNINPKLPTTKGGPGGTTPP